MKEIVDALEKKRAEARLGGGRKRIDSQHAKGKLTSVRLWLQNFESAASSSCWYVPKLSGAGHRAGP